MRRRRTNVPGGPDNGSHHHDAGTPRRRSDAASLSGRVPGVVRERRAL